MGNFNDFCNSSKNKNKTTHSIQCRQQDISFQSVSYEDENNVISCLYKDILIMLSSSHRTNATVVCSRNQYHVFAYFIFFVPADFHWHSLFNNCSRGILDKCTESSFNNVIKQLIIICSNRVHSWFDFKTLHWYKLVLVLRVHFT